MKGNQTNKLSLAKLIPSTPTARERSQEQPEIPLCFEYSPAPSHAGPSARDPLLFAGRGKSDQIRDQSRNDRTSGSPSQSRPQSAQSPNRRPRKACSPPGRQIERTTYSI